MDVIKFRADEEINKAEEGCRSCNVIHETSDCNHDTRGNTR